MTESEQIVDVLTEFINIGAGKAASSLNDLFRSHTRTNIPAVTIINRNVDCRDSTADTSDNFTVSMNFNGALSGSASLIFTSDSISKIAEFTGPGPSPEQSTSFHKSVLLETANIVINAIIGSISNMVKTEIEYSVPVTSESILHSTNITMQDFFTIKALTTFTLETYNISTIVLICLKDTLFVHDYLQKLDK
jgi:chemotaxis protein CheC